MDELTARLDQLEASILASQAASAAGNASGEGAGDEKANAQG